MIYDNLVGLTVQVKKVNPFMTELKGKYIPVTITANYPNFLVGVVQEHDYSKPYTITIHKHDISTREVVLK